MVLASTRPAHFDVDRTHVSYHEALGFGQMTP